jgi:hypothetical protein
MLRIQEVKQVWRGMTEDKRQHPCSIRNEAQKDRRITTVINCGNKYRRYLIFVVTALSVHQKGLGGWPLPHRRSRNN